MSKLKLNTDLTARERQTFGKRLLRLEAHLATLPRKAYNHGTYIKQHNECGTVGCALGHATASKLFRGLKIKTVRDDWYNDITIRTTDDTDLISEAANEYFGPEAYERVFASYAYGHRVGAAAVRTRLRKLAAERYGVTTA